MRHVLGRVYAKVILNDDFEDVLTCRLDDWDIHR